MADNPLNKYFDLIESDHISIIYSEFHSDYNFHSSFDPLLYEDHEIYWEVNNNCYALKSISQNKILKTFTYREHLNDYLNQYVIEFKTTFRDQIIEKSEKSIFDYTKLLQKEIFNLKSLLDSKQYEAKEVIYTSLKELDIFLSKYSFGGFIRWEQIKNSNNSKIKWLGKVSELATLFSELQAGTSNLKIKLVDNSRQELKKFILDNFVDENNMPFNHETVYRYLDDSKTDIKKSKNRIDIRKVEEE